MTARKEIGFAFIITIFLLVVCGFVFQAWKTQSHIRSEDLGSLPVPKKSIRCGINLNEYITLSDQIKPNQFLADLLLPHGISYAQIAELSANAKKVFDVRGLRTGRNYRILLHPETKKAKYFLYEPGKLTQYVFDLDSLSCREIKQTPDRVRRIISGKIENGSSLWSTIEQNGFDNDLVLKFDDAFAWSIDFSKISAGDSFRVYYDELFFAGEYVNIGDVYAMYFKTSGNEYYGVYYKNTKFAGYYDLNGIPMRKAFLKAPLVTYRLSSAFSRRRFHPVDKRFKPHLGTDFAAPRGTNIHATADGVITKIGYTSGNGNYIKIKHDDTYSTQYLHMQRFASGMAKGVHVKQGQTIGYVGSTGKATGPHVCYRFWKNGKQVDPRRQNLPEPDPLPQSELPDYFVHRDNIIEQFNQKDQTLKATPTTL